MTAVARPGALPPASAMLSTRIATALVLIPLVLAALFGLPPAGWALAACALLGVVIGYSGGALAAPAADQDEYFAAAFAAPAPMMDSGDPG